MQLKLESSMGKCTAGLIGRASENSFRSPEQASSVWGFLSWNMPDEQNSARRPVGERNFSDRGSKYVTVEN